MINLTLWGLHEEGSTVCIVHFPSLMARCREVDRNFRIQTNALELFRVASIYLSAKPQKAEFLQRADGADATRARARMALEHLLRPTAQPINYVFRSGTRHK